MKPSAIINGHKLYGDLKSTLKLGWVFNTATKRTECVYCGGMFQKGYAIPCDCQKQKLWGHIDPDTPGLPKVIHDFLLLHEDPALARERRERIIESV